MHIFAEEIDAKYSPNGNNILTIREKTARLWNLKGNLLSVIGKEGDVLSATFSPDSKLIAITDSDGNVELWDYQGIKKLALNGNKSLVNSVAFSTDGKFIAAASLDRNISLWNIQGKLLSVRKDQERIASLVFSPDSKSILTVNTNGIVHRWDLSSRNPNLAITIVPDSKITPASAR
jgi:WD40 repeat protein